MGEIKIMTTKEVAALCGVTSRTVSGNARKAGVILEDGKTHNWTDEEIRRLKAVLISNQVRQPTTRLPTTTWPRLSKPA